MLITKPDDKTGNEYHVVNLYGHTVHAYLDKHAAERTLEGDQRIFTWSNKERRWLEGKPSVHPDIAHEFKGRKKL